jgi:hypothetical protein
MAIGGTQGVLCKIDVGFEGSDGAFVSASACSGKIEVVMSAGVMVYTEVNDSRRSLHK